MMMISIKDQLIKSATANQTRNEIDRMITMTMRWGAD